MSQPPPRYPVAVQRHAVEQVLQHHRPVTQVARQLGCSPQSVKNWIEKYRNSFAQTTFLPLQVSDADLVTAKIELVTKNGLTLRFPAGMSSENLCAIVKQLEVSSC